MRDPGFPVFDADNHMYEPPEALLTHLPARYKDAIRFVGVGKRTLIALNGRITDYMPNPTFERVAAPGTHADFYRGMNPHGLTLREMAGDPIDCLPAYREPGARLELLDEQGIHRALVYPTLANLVEQSLLDDPDLAHAAIHALNRWMHEVWSFNYQDRIFAVPVITPPIVEDAIAELDWVLERGARVVLMRPAPASGLRGSRSIAFPEFDPFWARVQEADILVVFHATFSILNEYVKLWEPPSTDNAFKQSAFKMLAGRHRDIEDTIAAMICHGALSRFPGLKIASVENGSEWVPHLLEALDKVFRQVPGDFTEHPIEVFHRNLSVNPSWENDLPALVDLLGADRVLFGSDYPHPEGMADPLVYLDELRGFDDASVRKIMSENANSLLGLSTVAAATAALPTVAAGAGACDSDPVTV